MTTPDRAGVVIVGASIGGLTTAETLREEGYGGRILLVGDESYAPYSRPSLSKQILLSEWEPHQASVREASEIDALDIELRTSSAATGLDVENRILHTADGDIAFDELVIATGAEARRHPDLPDCSPLRTMEDALRLRDALHRAGCVAVVGPGILGSEIASAARSVGAETLIVGRTGALSFGGVGTLLSGPLERLHRDHDVDLDLATRIERVARRGDGFEIEFAGGRIRRFDLVVPTIGGTPRVDWLASSSLALGDGVECDEAGRAAPGVSAVGDVAAWMDAITGQRTRVEHQSNAIAQAIAVAIRIVHGDEPEQPVPLFWSEIHKARIQAYGWFDAGVPLTSVSANDAAGGTVYSSTADGVARGVVGWNASPKVFRQARAMVAGPSASLAA